MLAAAVARPGSSSPLYLRLLAEALAGAAPICHDEVRGPRSRLYIYYRAHEVLDGVAVSCAPGRAMISKLPAALRC